MLTKQDWEKSVPEIAELEKKTNGVVRTEDLGKIYSLVFSWKCNTCGAELQGRSDVDATLADESPSAVEFRRSEDLMVLGAIEKAVEDHPCTRPQ